eukprot:11709095-Heterocapsa_arctica.AAC.1
MKNPDATEFLPAHMLPAPAHGRRPAADSDEEHDDARQQQPAGLADPWEGWDPDAVPAAGDRDGNTPTPGHASGAGSITPAPAPAAGQMPPPGAQTLGAGSLSNQIGSHHLL